MERDTYTNFLGVLRYNFNSHAHVERDLDKRTKQARYKHISTHTLTWSVTDVLLDFSNSVPISTHTLTWSVTLAMFSVVDLFVISTHTLTWSVTLDVVYIWCLLNVMRTYFFI